MADVKKINFDNGDEYDIKDEEARNQIQELNETLTELTDIGIYNNRVTYKFKTILLSTVYDESGTALGAVDTIKARWEELDLATIYLAVVSANGGINVAIIQKYHDNHLYGSILTFGYSGLSGVSFAQVRNGVWGETVNL